MDPISAQAPLFIQLLWVSNLPDSLVRTTEPTKKSHHDVGARIASGCVGVGAAR